MNEELKAICNKHQRTPASQAACQHGTPLTKGCTACTAMTLNLNAGRPLHASLPPRSPQGQLDFESCFRSDEEIIGNLAACIVEEFPTRDAQTLVRLFCTEGPRIGLELHEALNAPEVE